MQKIKQLLKKLPPFSINYLIIITWLLILLNTDSFYIIYLLLGLLFIFSLKQNITFNKKENIITILFSSLLSFLVTIANYNVINSNFVIETIALLTLFICGIIVFYRILSFIFNNINNIKIFKNNDKIKHIFIKTFLFISIIDIIVLILCYYPGLFTYDSVNQIKQIETGNYSNHHPYWHTMIIKFFYCIGKQYFNSANVGIFLYSIFQIFCVAAIVSYANLTLQEIDTKKIINILLPISFVLLPQHLFLSFTIWKDVLFASSILLFLISTYRIIKKFKTTYLDYLLLLISSFGFCLLRSNGWYAFVVVFILSIFMFRKTNIKLILVILFTLTSSFYLQHNYLESKNISKPDLIEHLSIPVQQVARVIVECDDLTNEQLSLLSKIININEVQDTYNPYYARYIKDFIRGCGNSNYLKDNLNDYFKLYIELGLSHPKQYIEAWIDQTKGFFNGGYEGEIFNNFSIENDYGINTQPLITIIKTLSVIYGRLFVKLHILKPFISIGLHVWIVITILYLAILKTNKLTIFYTLTLLSIIGTLLIATPLHSSIRYAYAIFTCIFFLIVITIKEISNDK